MEQQTTDKPSLEFPVYTLSLHPIQPLTDAPHHGGVSHRPRWTPLPDTALSFQAHNDLLRTYEAKLLAFGIPLDNVGFKPLETAVIGQTLGQGPAGLVGAPT